MPDDPSPPAPTPPRSPDDAASRPNAAAVARKERSARALRDNLRRRKLQTRARRAAPPATGT